MSTVFKLNVAAGNHKRDNCPVSFKLSKENVLLQDKNVENLSAADENGSSVPVQWTEEGNDYVISWMVNGLEANQRRTYAFSFDGQGELPEGMALIQEENRIDIKIRGSFFTSYVFDPAVAKPYLGPIAGPYGDSYTRLDFEIKEHPHHRSVWLAIGDVNGIDMWNEPAGVHGKQKHQSFRKIIAGPVYAKITANNIWTSFKDRPQVAESRTMTFYNTSSECRYVDMDVTFTANYGQVEFGATKEAGPLGIRLAESMKVKNGGTMVNSYGAIGESECWGKRAEWCDYYGQVNGHTLGIAAFDNPGNDNYPTYWHIRDYGLMAPNNFYFDGGKLLKPGETMNYKYRICFHDGDTTKANVAERYHDYVNPPKIEFAEI